VPPLLASSTARARQAPPSATLLTVCLATALLLLNVSAPNVALPAIAAGLGATFSDQQWITSVYALTLASTLLTAGALADRLGRRRVFLLGLAGFTVTSALCALAANPLQLVAFRALSGMCGAVVFSAALALLAQTYAGPERARALGLWGATIAAAFAIGPLEGGLLTELVGWRALFWINVVVALPLLPFALRRLPPSHRTVAERRAALGRLDLPGTITLVAGLTLLVYALIRGNTEGWASLRILTAVGLGALLLVVFAAVERRAAEPLVRPELFRARSSVGASIIALTFAAATFAPVLFVTLFLLQVAGQGPAAVGLQLLPFALVSLVASVAGGRYAGVLPIRLRLIGGLLVVATGLTLLTGTTPESTWLHFLPGMLVAGAGTGLVNPAMTYVALAVVPDEHSGMASGANNTCRQLGVAGGIAGLGALIERALAAGVRERLAAVTDLAAHSRELGVQAADGALRTALDTATSLAGAPGRAAVQAAHDAAYADAINDVFLVAAGLALLGAVAAAALVHPAELTD